MERDEEPQNVEERDDAVMSALHGLALKVKMNMMECLQWHQSKASEFVTGVLVERRVDWYITQRQDCNGQIGYLFRCISAAKLND